ncbi:MAG: hypothetical protein CSA95_03145 [Bacteroidetes bacterium]|nr:MAG: hypothetical protein CSA95_03145 [Bacteroidota bacterium]
MTKKDLGVLAGTVLFFAPFVLFPTVYQQYLALTHGYPFLTAGLKFALLATFGEVLGLRIRTGGFHTKGFGILPKAMVWFFLGICIKAAFVIFVYGAPMLLTKLGIHEPWQELLSQSIFKTRSPWHLLAAFTISVTMNTFFAPVFMTLHKMTDIHIEQGGGSLKGFFTPFHPGTIMQKINWDIQWNFVFKKTIPFFWYPAHTLTFMLPPEHRILFAALLGVVLGVILSIANLKEK